MSGLLHLDKIRTKLINQCVSKDETRPYLSGVTHHEPLKALVSCDGHKGCILRSRYNEKLAGHIINPATFKVIEREYPKIEGVVPDHTKMKKASFTIGDKHCVVDRGRKTTSTYFHVSESGECLVTQDKRDDCGPVVFAVQAQFLKHLAGYEWSFAYNNELSPILVALKDDDFDGDVFLIMPINV